MKNILAENMLRFGPKNLTESEKQKLSKLTEQADENNIANLGNLLLTGNVVPNGVSKLEEPLADINILTALNQDVNTINSKDAAFAGAYARPLYISKNKTMFFIGRSMIGGPGVNNWSVESGWKICNPNLNNDGFTTRSRVEQEVLNTNSALATYKQIYKFNMQGYRDNEEITNLVQILEKENIIPSLKEEINDSAYSAFLGNQHDSAMKMIG